MVSNVKLYSRLDSLEAQLIEELVPHLKKAAEGNNDLVFCVTVFNPHRELKHKTDKLSEELIELGSQILALKEKLGEPSDGTPAERLCWYCREWGNLSSHHRQSSVGLAKQFLAEIKSRL